MKEILANLLVYTLFNVALHCGLDLYLRYLFLVRVLDFLALYHFLTCGVTSTASLGLWLSALASPLAL